MAVHHSAIGAVLHLLQLLLRMALLLLRGSGGLYGPLAPAAAKQRRKAVLQLLHPQLLLPLCLLLCVWHHHHCKACAHREHLARCCRLPVGLGCCGWPCCGCCILHLSLCLCCCRFLLLALAVVGQLCLRLRLGAHVWRGGLLIRRRLRHALLAPLPLLWRAAANQHCHHLGRHHWQPRRRQDAAGRLIASSC
jgi:hypothetical protein